MYHKLDIISQCTKKNRGEIYLHAWVRINIYLMHSKNFRWRLRPKLVILITSYDIITKQRQVQNTLYKNTVPSQVLYHHEKVFIHACYPPTNHSKVQSQ
jgi:hypothetical protein